MSWLEWQRRRSHLNHDWLRNVLMPALGKLLRVANGQIADQLYFGEFVARLQCEWPAKVREFETLVETFTRAMSPVSYFDEAPLAGFPADEASWMREVTHHLWLRSCRACRLTENCFAALKSANDSFVVLSSAIDHHERLSDTVNQIMEFQVACKVLGDAASEMPTRSEVCRRHYE